MSDVSPDDIDPNITADVVELPADAPEKFSAREAAQALASLRHAKRQASVEPEARATEQPADGQSPPDDAGPEEVPSETNEADPAELPPVEPPRSWTKEDKELFRGLPHETQLRVAERERSREADFLRRQNEAAELRKSFETKASLAEQERQKYEAALPQIMGMIQSQVTAEFSDVRTPADLEALARTDPSRFALWQLRTQQASQVQQEIQAAQQRAEHEKGQKLSEYLKEQDKLFSERVKDKTPDQIKAIGEKALNYLTDLGFSQEDLGKAYNSMEGISLRDNRIQGMIAELVELRDWKARATSGVKNLNANKASVPPVQRPGTSAPRVSASEAKQRAGFETLGKASNVRDQLKAAASILAARRGR